MKFFIGAKNLSGQVIVAEIVEADDFEDARCLAYGRAENEAGAGKFCITAVNEYLELGAVSFRSPVASFLEGSPA